MFSAMTVEELFIWWDEGEITTLHAAQEVVGHTTAENKDTVLLELSLRPDLEQAVKQVVTESSIGKATGHHTAKERSASWKKEPRISGLHLRSTIASRTCQRRSSPSQAARLASLPYLAHDHAHSSGFISGL